MLNIYMKTFKEYVLLQESVTFSVEGFQPSSVKSLEELGWAIEKQLSTTFGSKYQLNKHPLIRFTPDGSYYSNHNITQGIMSFYAGDLDEQTTIKCLKGIEYYLKEHGASLISPIKKEVSNMFDMPVFRFQIKLNVKNESIPPELNIANRNAEILLKNILGIAKNNEIQIGSISARELLMKLSMVTDFTKEMSALSSSSDKNWHDNGLSLEQIEKYIKTLENMSQWAIKNGYDEITWC